MQGHREYMEDVYIQGKVGCPLRIFEDFSADLQRGRTSFVNFAADTLRQGAWGQFIRRF